MGPSGGPNPDLPHPPRTEQRPNVLQATCGNPPIPLAATLGCVFTLHTFAPQKLQRCTSKLHPCAPLPPSAPPVLKDGEKTAPRSVYPWLGFSWILITFLREFTRSIPPTPPPPPPTRHPYQKKKTPGLLWLTYKHTNMLIMFGANQRFRINYCPPSVSWPPRSKRWGFQTARQQLAPHSWGGGWFCFGSAGFGPVDRPCGGSAGSAWKR